MNELLKTLTVGFSLPQEIHPELLQFFTEEQNLVAYIFERKIISSFDAAVPLMIKLAQNFPEQVTA